MRQVSGSQEFSRARHDDSALRSYHGDRDGRTSYLANDSVVLVVLRARRHVGLRWWVLGHLVAPVDRTRHLLVAAAHGDLRVRCSGRPVVGIPDSHVDIRPPLHPSRLRCSSLKYGSIFSVVAPCRLGASAPSVHQLFRGHHTSAIAERRRREPARGTFPVGRHAVNDSYRNS